MHLEGSSTRYEGYTHGWHPVHQIDRDQQSQAGDRVTVLAAVLNSAQFSRRELAACWAGCDERVNHTVGLVGILFVRFRFFELVGNKSAFHCHGPFFVLRLRPIDGRKRVAVTI